MADKAKKSNLATLNKILDEVFPMVATNFSKSELIKLGSGLLSYKLEESTGFPLDYAMGKEVTEPVTGLDCLIPTTLATNVNISTNTFSEIKIIFLRRPCLSEVSLLRTRQALEMRLCRRQASI